jgi:hypothetical protein
MALAHGSKKDDMNAGLSFGDTYRKSWLLLQARCCYQMCISFMLYEWWSCGFARCCFTPSLSSSTVQTDSTQPAQLTCFIRTLPSVCHKLLPAAIQLLCLCQYLPLSVQQERFKCSSIYCCRSLRGSTCCCPAHCSVTAPASQQSTYVFYRTTFNYWVKRLANAWGCWLCWCLAGAPSSPRCPDTATAMACRLMCC